MEEFFRLSFIDLNIDPDYHELLQYRVADLLDETNKEVAWDLEYQKTKTEKLKAYYLDELEVDRYSAKSFKTNSIVTSFKVKKFTEYMDIKLDEINRIVEDERSRLNVDQESQEDIENQEEHKRAGSAQRERTKRT